MLGFDALELDGDFLPGDYVGSEVDVTERTGSDLPANPVFITDAEVLAHVSHLTHPRSKDQGDKTVTVLCLVGKTGWLQA